jgi:class 3 adenylate cyclase
MERALCPVLIGREPEQTALEDALLAANRGNGQIVLLAGEAGMGKTRLASELQKRAFKIGMTVLWGGCSEADLALPYLPFLEAIGNYLATASLDAVREELGPIRIELAGLFPQLEPGASVREQGDPAQAKLRLFEAVMAMLRIPATAGGLLLVLEDLHWSDTSTRELLDYMARRMAGMRIMVLGTYRSDELHRKHPLAPMIQGWRRTKAVEVIELQPLSERGIAGMVGAIFDAPDITAEFADFLYGRSEGNPFVLEELLKAALDRGDIYRTPQRWERKALADLRLPQTVRDTILLRVERLAPEQSDILQTAAVLGPAWNYQSLVALSGRDEATVQTALHASIQQQLLEEDPGGTGRYRFRHALTRESIYEDMIAPRRQQLHAQAAAMLAEQPGTPAAELAYHLFAANRWADAIPIGIKAAEEAERNWAYRDAAQLYERMLAHVADDLTRGQLLCRLGHAYFQAVDPARAQRYLEEGIPLLERHGQRQEVAHYRLVLGRCFWERSHPDIARSIYEQARAELEAEGPSEDLAIAYIRLAGLEMFESEYDACFKLATRGVEVAKQAGAELAAIWARLFVGSALCGLGRVDEGLALMDESRRQATAQGALLIARNALHNSIVRRMMALRASEARPLLDLYRGLPAAFFMPFDEGGVCWFLGYPKKALPFLEQALALARESESSTGEHWIRREIAAVLSALGRREEALARLPAIEPLHELQDLRPTKQARIQILLDCGQPERAVTEAMTVFSRKAWGPPSDRRVLFDSAVEALLSSGRVEEAQQLVVNTREPGESGPYQDRMEGRLALARGETELARERLAASVAGFQEVDYGIELMRSLRSLAEVEVRTGNIAKAEAHLRRVIELAEDREAIYQGTAARGRLAELGLEANMPAEGAPAEPVEISERLVTVLFLDIRGYTRLSSTEAPERVADTVANLYRWARQEIERHHGLIDKYEGDAVMATFNVAGARLDHTVQALQAAIAIRDKAAAASLPVGGAVAVGPAIVGKLSADSPISTYGEVTNLASRLQAQAQAGEILLSQEAQRRSGDWLRGQGLSVSEETLELKGFPAPVTAFRLARGSARPVRRP